jgi:hypothetical protein
MSYVVNLKERLFLYMEKRILIPGIILSAALILIISLFLINNSKKDRINPLNVIPQDAVLLLKIKGLEFPKMLSDEKSEVWNDLSIIPAISQINSHIKLIDSLLKLYPEMYDFTINRDIYISGHLSGGKGINFLCLTPLAAGMNERKALNALEKIAKTLSFSCTKREYENKAILSIKTKSEINLHFSIIKGLLLYSKSPSLLEDAISQSTSSKSITDNPGLKKVMNALGKNKDANLLIDFKQLGKYFSKISNNQLAPGIKKYDDFGNWSELDISVKEDLIMLNGFASKSDSSASFIKSICALDQVKIEVSTVLPSNVSCFFAFGLSNPGLNYKNYLSYLKQTGHYTSYSANLANLNATYGIDFDKFFLSLMADELVLAFSNNAKETEGSHYILLKCNSGNEAEKALLGLTKKLENKLLLPGNQENKKLVISYSPDNIEKHSIYKLPIYPLFGRLLGDFFNVFEENYLTVIDNYIVIAGSYKEACQFVYDCMLHKTLNNDEVFRSFTSNISPKSYLLCYSNMANSQLFYKKYLSDATFNGWKQYITAFEKSQTLGFQISEVSDIPYLSLFIQRQKDFRGQPHTVWESLLDSSISLKPKFVINHNTRENEIFVQDNQNNIYLLNRAGRILWKVRLNEPINSDIFQIDYYKNGKLQLLFSTKNYLHLIDRNGNYIEHYPLRLRAESTAGMALFDYENDKNYRIFIPCEDKMVYTYNADGTLISGWNFSGADYPVTQPVNHFRVTDKDYIVFGDRTSTYILDRKGEARVKTAEIIFKSPNNNYFLVNNNSLTDSYLITTDTNGFVCKIYFDGRVEKQEIKNFTAQHFFDFKDVNADGKSDYIFFDKNELYVYQSGGSLLFEKKFEENITQRPIYYNFSYNDRKIGLVSTEKNLIYLVNNDGKMYKDFPLEGTTLFSVGYFDPATSRFNLIVGGRNNFLYNYAVE